jgi:hypothetical protein
VQQHPSVQPLKRHVCSVYPLCVVPPPGPTGSTAPSHTFASPRSPVEWALIPIQHLSRKVEHAERLHPPVQECITPGSTRFCYQPSTLLTLSPRLLSVRTTPCAHNTACLQQLHNTSKQQRKSNTASVPAAHSVRLIYRKNHKGWAAQEWASWGLPGTSILTVGTTKGATDKDKHNPGQIIHA